MDVKAYITTRITLPRLAHTLIGMIQMVGAGEFFPMEPSSPNNHNYLKMNKTHLIQPIHAKKWIRDSMSLGPSLALSRIIEKKWDWENSLFMVYARKHTPYHQLIQFNTGGKITSTESDKWLLDFTNKKYGKNYTFIVENWLATPNSTYLREDNLPYFTVNNDVYFLFKSECKIKSSKIFTNPPPSFHAYLIRKNISIDIGKKFQSSDILNFFSENIEMLVCGIYDGESYMLSFPKNTLPIQSEIINTLNEEWERPKE